jgi:hypothetical protein
MQSAAQTLGLSARTVRRLVVRYKTSAQTTSLLAHQRRPNKNLRRLGTDRERPIDTTIDQFYLVRPRKPMEEVYREVVRRCRKKRWVAPARNSVLSRIRALDARMVARRRLGAKSAESVALSTPGMHGRVCSTMEPPTGRHFWQQSWYTICRAHGIALVVRNLAHVPANRSYR